MQDLSPILPIFLFFGALVFFRLVTTALGKKNNHQNFAPYQKRKELFSPAERSFLGVLEQAVNNEYRVFGKVRLGDIIKPKNGLSNSHFYTALNKINRKHVDYVVCRKETYEVLGVVELDDKTHKRVDRRDRDNFVDNALNEAGVPILHFPAKASYSVSEVKEALNYAFSLWTQKETKAEDNEFQYKSMPEKTIAPTEGWTLGKEAALEKAPEDVRELCPDCGTPMRPRKIPKGPHQGKIFFFCEDNPKCKTVKRVEA